MSLFPESELHEPKLIAPVRPWGGPTYQYRGARIECYRGEHVCGLFLEGHPLNGLSFGVVGTVTPLVDLWVEKRELPPYMRAAAKS
jgi:hypothetical protein